MTKEELEKEATEYALEWGDKTDGTYASCRDGYLAGAEPREKRIADLKKQIADLEWQLQEVAKDNDNYKAENKKLEAQIEKMKEKHKQDELGLIISNSSARAELEKQLEQAKELLRRSYDNYISMQPLRGEIEKFLKEEE